MSKRTHHKKLSEKEIPEDYFTEEKNINCPQCGCNKLCLIGGSFFPGQKKKEIYLCSSCRKEFQIEV